MIDSHAHLNLEDFDKDVDMVIKNAFENGVKSIIVIGIDAKTNKKALSIVEQYEGLYATVGIHPSVADDGGVETIVDYLSHPKVVAIGECGIDLHWRQDNLKQQLDIFDQQIRLAIAYDLPLIIHTRNSFAEAYQAVLPYKGKVKGVFHCFSSGFEDASKAIDLGFYIGIDGPVTFKNGKEAKDVATRIPLNRLLVETDSPYLAPMPHRGKRNEPKYLPLIVKEIALLRGLTLMEVIQQTTANAKQLFHLGD